MTKNLAASIRARLLAVAKTQGADFNQILVRFALERFATATNKDKGLSVNSGKPFVFGVALG